MTHPEAGLLAGLLHDAAMFPPRRTALPAAVREHVGHLAGWYRPMVGPLVCLVDRLAALDAELLRADRAPVEVSVVVPAGLDAVADAVRSWARHQRVRPICIEVPLGGHFPRAAIRQLAPLLGRLPAVYLEVAAADVDERFAHDLAASGVGLKLRVGTTRIDGFLDEQTLARCLVVCASEPVGVKCVGGLRRAVRGTDSGLTPQHGLLNLLLAARVAAATANVAATAAALGERTAGPTVDRIAALGPTEARSARGVLRAIATSDPAVVVADLVRLGLLRQP